MSQQRLAVVLPSVHVVQSPRGTRCFLLSRQDHLQEANERRGLRWPLGLVPMGHASRRRGLKGALSLVAPCHLLKKKTSLGNQKRERHTHLKSKLMTDAYCSHCHFAAGVCHTDSDLGFHTEIPVKTSPLPSARPRPQRYSLKPNHTDT